MLKVLLIRHAQCEMNLHITDRIGGRTNHSPLTALGEQQSRALGQHLQQALQHMGTAPQDLKLFSSTAVRAVDTAKHVMEALKIETSALMQSEQLLELEQGEWEGAKRRECYTPELTAAFAADPWETAWNFAPPGGESQKQVEERMVCFLQQQILPALTPEAPALVFSHGMAIKCLLRHILHSLPTMSRQITLNNTSITEIGFMPSKLATNGDSSSSGGGGGSTWHIMRVNDIAHLPYDLRS